MQVQTQSQRTPAHNDAPSRHKTIHNKNFQTSTQQETRQQPHAMPAHARNMPAYERKTPEHVSAQPVLESDMPVLERKMPVRERTITPDKPRQPHLKPRQPHLKPRQQFKQNVEPIIEIKAWCRYCGHQWCEEQFPEKPCKVGMLVRINLFCICCRNDWNQLAAITCPTLRIKKCHNHIVPKVLSHVLFSDDTASSASSSTLSSLETATSSDEASTDNDSNEVAFELRSGRWDEEFTCCVGSRRATDWQCPTVACRNHVQYVFGRNAICPLCNAARPPIQDTFPSDSDYSTEPDSNTTLHYKRHRKTAFKPSKWVQKVTQPESTTNTAKPLSACVSSQTSRCDYFEIGTPTSQQPVSDLESIPDGTMSAHCRRVRGNMQKHIIVTPTRRMQQNNEHVQRSPTAESSVCSPRSTSHACSSTERSPKDTTEIAVTDFCPSCDAMTIGTDVGIDTLSNRRILVFKCLRCDVQWHETVRSFAHLVDASCTSDSSDEIHGENNLFNSSNTAYPSCIDQCPWCSRDVVRERNHYDTFDFLVPCVFICTDCEQTWQHACTPRTHIEDSFARALCEPHQDILDLVVHDDAQANGLFSGRALSTTSNDNNESSASSKEKGAREDQTSCPEKFKPCFQPVANTFPGETVDEAQTRDIDNTAHLRTQSHVTMQSNHAAKYSLHDSPDTAQVLYDSVDTAQVSIASYVPNTFGAGLQNGRCYANVDSQTCEHVLFPGRLHNQLNMQRTRETARSTSQPCSSSCSPKGEPLHTKQTKANNSLQRRVWRAKPLTNRCSHTMPTAAQHNVSSHVVHPSIANANHCYEPSTERPAVSNANAKCCECIPAQTHAFTVMPSAGHAAKSINIANMNPQRIEHHIELQQHRTCPTCGSNNHKDCNGRYRARAATARDLAASGPASATTATRNLSAQVPVAWLSEHWLSRLPCQTCGSRYHSDCKGRFGSKNNNRREKRTQPQKTRVWITKAQCQEIIAHPTFQSLAEQVELMMRSTQATATSINECPEDPATEPLDHRLRHNIVWGILRRAADKLGVKRYSGYTLQNGRSELSVPQGCQAHVFRWTLERSEIDYRKVQGPQTLQWSFPIPVTHVIVIHEDMHVKCQSTAGAAFDC